MNKMLCSFISRIEIFYNSNERVAQVFSSSKESSNLNSNAGHGAMSV